LFGIVKHDGVVPVEISQLRVILFVIVKRGRFYDGQLALSPFLKERGDFSWYYPFISRFTQIKLEMVKFQKQYFVIHCAFENWVFKSWTFDKCFSLRWVYKIPFLGNTSNFHVMDDWKLLEWSAGRTLTTTVFSGSFIIRFLTLSHYQV
jgi:hypothetical protein